MLDDRLARSTSSSRAETNISDEDLLEFQTFLRRWDDGIIGQEVIACELDFDVPESDSSKFGKSANRAGISVAAEVRGVVGLALRGIVADLGGNAGGSASGSQGGKLVAAAGDSSLAGNVADVRSAEASFSNDSANFWAQPQT